MNANEIFEVTLLLWGGVAALFILAGFIIFDLFLHPWTPPYLGDKLSNNAGQGVRNRSALRSGCPSTYSFGCPIRPLPR